MCPTSILVADEVKSRKSSETCSPTIVTEALLVLVVMGDEALGYPALWATSPIDISTIKAKLHERLDYRRSVNLTLMP